MPSFSHLTLRTTRLLLRPLVDADAPALFAIFSDPAVMRYWSSPPWTLLSQAQEYVARDVEAMARGEFLRLGVIRRDNEMLIGTCSLFNIVEQCRRVEVGYGLAREAWGRGFMNEALRALLEYAFTTLDVNRIEADIDPRNAASAKTLERLGFRREGYLRERWIVNGEISDSALYGLLRSEWSGLHSEGVAGGVHRGG
jgi:[ribosomal protein S5]-alanine N-acetyltransferase